MASLVAGSSSSSNGAEPTLYKKYPSRFIILILFGASSAVNAFLWISFAPIFATVASFWNVTSLAVNFLSLVCAFRLRAWSPFPPHLTAPPPPHTLLQS